MPASINRQRLANTFVTLCETDSPSRREGRMAALLRDIFTRLGADEIFEDDSGAVTGSECGNLFVRFRGEKDQEPIFFNCHMDTVEPGTGVKVVRQGNIFRSEGKTILGSDDKSGIAALIEAVETVREHNLPVGPLELVFTTCEEIGLLGAKALNPDNIRARMGYALDSSGFGRVIIGAPAANRLRIRLRGVAAHAGLHPEMGINAIILAANALAKAPCGRIDRESTVNFGTIRGGTASNIVPEEVCIEGEVRSHAQDKLDRLTTEVEKAFYEVIGSWQDPEGYATGKPQVDISTTLDFPVMRLDRHDPVIRRISRAADTIGLKLEFRTAGGGSDANIFNGYGLQTAIVATGMTHVHSTDEQVDLDDMVELTRLVLALMRG